MSEREPEKTECIREWEFCAMCGGDLDTGYKCANCGMDWDAARELVGWYEANRDAILSSEIPLPNYEKRRRKTDPPDDDDPVTGVPEKPKCQQCGGTCTILYFRGFDSEPERGVCYLCKGTGVMPEPEKQECNELLALKDCEIRRLLREIERLKSELAAERELNVRAPPTA